MRDRLRLLETARLLTLLALSLLGSAALSQSELSFGPVGGPGGQPFRDSVGSNSPRGPLVRLVALYVRSGNYVDSITALYAPIGKEQDWNAWSSSTRHGGNGGEPSRLDLEAGDCITSLGVRYGKYIDSLFVKTKQGVYRRWGGNGGNTDYVYTAPAGMCIDGFLGRAGDYLDAVGVFIK